MSSGTRASAIINANTQQVNQQQQQHQHNSRNSNPHDQEKSRIRRRSVSPTAMENGQDVESYYHPQQNGNYQQQSMTSMTSESHHRNSINHQDVHVMAHESPYSKDVPDVEENGGMIHAANGSSSKYSLLQFAAQHFRNE